MKRSIILTLVIIFLLFSSCMDTKEPSQNPPQESYEDISFDAVKEYLNGVDENFGNFSREFREIIENNSIDKAMLLEEENTTPSTTVEMIDFAKKYSTIWETELDTIYKSLKSRLEGKARKSLENSQSSWEKYCSGELLLLREMYLSTTGTGSIIPIVIAYKELIFKRDRTIELTYYYYSLTEEFSFVYK